MRQKLAIAFLSFHTLSLMVFATTSKTIGSNSPPRVTWQKFEDPRNNQGYLFVFHVADPAGKSHEIRMSNLTTHVQSAETYNALLVVIGEAGSAASTITIFDYNEGREKDSFLCYDPVPSKTNRFIAFNEFYPRFSDAALTSNTVRVYDLQSLRLKSASHSKNRAGPILAANSDPGIPVFPTDYADLRWVDNASQRHQTGKFLWLFEDKKLAFVDHYQAKNWLVSIDFAAGLKNPIDSRKEIKVLNYLSPTRTQQAAYGYDLVVLGIAASKKGTILIKISTAAHKESEIEMQVPGAGAGPFSLKLKDTSVITVARKN